MGGKRRGGGRGGAGREGGAKCVNGLLRGCLSVNFVTSFGGVSVDASTALLAFFPEELEQKVEAAHSCTD